MSQTDARLRTFSISVGGRVRRLAVFSLLAASACLVPARADDPPAAVPDARRVDVGGYKLTLLTRGQGGPTVVIEPGMGLPAVESGEWNAVCDEIVKTTTVVRYDRAGLGTSDPSPTRPRTSRDFARDLHTLLVNAKAPGPYVLVAHSIGGLYVRVFAEMYPDEVAGVVLVDATHPDQDAKWLAAFPAETPEEPRALKNAREFLTARLSNRGDNPDGMDVVETRNQVRAAGTFGDKPLAILTHSPEWKMVPDLPDDVTRRLEDVWQELQAGSTALSTNHSHKIARKAGHHLHEEDPRLVIDAILEVIEKVRSQPRK